MNIRILSLLAALVLLTGCGHTPKRTAYNTLATTKQLVVSAVEAASELHIRAKITDNELAGVQSDYDNKFTPAFQTAVDLARQDYTQLTPENVAQLATQIINTVNSFKAR